MNDMKTSDVTRQSDDQGFVKFPHLCDVYDSGLNQASAAFARRYMAYLDSSKTERDAVRSTTALAEAAGFRALETFTKLEAGDKVYANIKNKGFMMAVIGKKAVNEGFRILGAHIDSPRLDLKPLPVQEDHELVYFRTHYYGGIKKYQWTSLPLALHGVAFRQDGSQVDIEIGEKDDEPRFCVTDLLPHLGREQMTKNAREFISAEALNLVVGASPAGDEETKLRFKKATLDYLEKTYQLRERDLSSAEISAVPAFHASFIGLDGMLIGAYGQDDKVCAYPAVQALLDVKNPAYTSVCLLSDKEEIGSEGNSGAKSRLYENVLAEILLKQSGAFDDFSFRQTLARSAMLSADVTAAYDPMYSSVYDSTNVNYLGHGISLCKYTGSGGKYNASDASAEFLSTVCRLFDRRGVCWQTGEMGKIEAGGGGTIAREFAVTGMDVLDCGVPVLSMHAPFELTHRHDVYETYRAYIAFIEEF